MKLKSASKAIASRDILFLATLVAILLFGGSSRADALSQPVVRLLSIGAIAASVVIYAGRDARPLRLPLLFVGGFAAVMSAQLIPVPPDWWGAFPPRDSFIPVLREVGLADVFRPLSLNPDGTVNALLALLPVLAIILTAAQASVLAHSRAVGVILLVAFVSAVLGLGQIYAGKPYFYSPTNEGSAVGLFANRNHFALLLAACFPLLALWVRMGQGSAQAVMTRRWLALCAGIAIFPLLVASGSRAGLLLGLVGAACSLLLVRREVASLLSGGKRALFVVVPIMAGIAAIALMLVFSRAESVDRLFADDNEDARVTILPHTLAMARDFLPWGSGGGSFISAFKVYEPHDILTRFYVNNAHNDPVQMIIEYGVFGFALMAVFLVWYLRRGWSAWQSRMPGNRAFAQAGTIVIFLSITASIVDYPLRTPALSGLFALACCWMLRQWQFSFRDARPPGVEPFGRTAGRGRTFASPRAAEQEVDGVP